MESRIAQSRTWDPRASDSGEQGRDHLPVAQGQDALRGREQSKADITGDELEK